MQRESRWQSNGEHLAFSGGDFEVGEVRGGGGPCAGAVYEASCAEDAVGCVDFDGVADGVGGEYGSVGAKIDCGCADGGEQGGGELTGIETVLVEEGEGVVCVNERG